MWSVVAGLVVVEMLSTWHGALARSSRMWWVLKMAAAVNVQLRSHLSLMLMWTLAMVVGLHLLSHSSVMLTQMLVLLVTAYGQW